MELSYYIFVMTLGIIFSLNRQLVNHSKLFFVIWFSVYSGLSLIVRTDFDVDINAYVASMPSSSLSIYFIREPVVWLGQRYLFSLTQDAYTVFVISDIILGLFLFRALSNFAPPQYTYFAILIFFPFVMGMQNIYRQWAACIFFLYCFSLVWNERSPYKAYIFFILSFLSHNVAAVFLPLLFLKKRTIIGKLSWILSFGVSGAGIYYGAETKSSAATGSNLALAYSFLLFLFVCLIAILDKGIVREARKKAYWLLISLLTLSIISGFLLSSVGAERISMFGLVISYPILANLLDERFKQKAIIRAIFTVLGFIPMFMFSVSKFIVS